MIRQELGGFCSGNCWLCGRGALVLTPNAQPSRAVPRGGILGFFLTKHSPPPPWMWTCLFFSATHSGACQQRTCAVNVHMHRQMFKGQGSSFGRCQIRKPKQIEPFVYLFSSVSLFFFLHVIGVPCFFCQYHKKAYIYIYILYLFFINS